MNNPRSNDAVVTQVRRVLKRFGEALNPEEFYEQVESGEVQVFPVGQKSIFVCQLFGDYAHIKGAAGDMQELLDHLSDICAWYEKHGATEITLQGRKGWTKVLSDRGWSPTGREANELRKELNHGHV
jgi:hypothetical protein